MIAVISLFTACALVAMNQSLSIAQIAIPLPLPPAPTFAPRPIPTLVIPPGPPTLPTLGPVPQPAPPAPVPATASAVSRFAPSSLSICNAQADTLSFAYATFDGAHFRTHGWWTIQPNTCREIAQAIDHDSTTFWYYASTRNAFWSGNNMEPNLCVDEQPFNIAQAELEHASFACSSRERFRRIDVTPQRTYTVRF
jgi:uncharacterized membrane protein